SRSGRKCFRIRDCAKRCWTVSPTAHTLLKPARSRIVSGARWKDGKRKKLRERTGQAPRHAFPWPRRPLRPKRPDSVGAGLRSLRGHGNNNPWKEEENNGLRVGQMKVSKLGQIRLSNAARRRGRKRSKSPPS